MGCVIAIFIGSCWLFFIAIAFGFSNIDGILIFIGIFWVVFLGGMVIRSFIKSANEKKKKLNDLQISSLEDGYEKALSIMEKLQWTPIGSMQVKERRYVTFRHYGKYIDDFDWLVKYISYSGVDAEYSTPYSMMSKTIGDSLLRCIKVNSDFTVTEIYRIPKTEEERKQVEKENTQFFENGSVAGDDKFEQLVQMNIERSREKLEARVESNPVVQYNIQLIKEREEELKLKIEEYKQLRGRQDDEVFISLSTTGVIDQEVYESQLEQIRDEITCLKEEIQELKEEIEEIREEIEYEIEEEG